MIHELRTYTLYPGKQGEYLKLNLEVGRKVRGDNYGILRGSWTTEFGTLNQYVHLWRNPVGPRAAFGGPPRVLDHGRVHRHPDAGLGVRVP